MAEIPERLLRFRPGYEEDFTPEEVVYLFTELTLGICMFPNYPESVDEKKDLYQYLFGAYIDDASVSAIQLLVMQASAEKLHRDVVSLEAQKTLNILGTQLLRYISSEYFTYKKNLVGI